MFGQQPELTKTQASLLDLQEQMRIMQKEEKKKIAEYEAKLEQVRNERLEWQARESSTRKDLQDCQERGKELLEQVVQLTHQQRQTKQSLLDQKFKTEATPLERTRFSADLSEARARVKEAEKRMKQAEEKAARLKPLEKEARKVKKLQSQLAWETRQSQAHLLALRSTIDRLRDREIKLVELTPRRRTKKKDLRTYRKPKIRLSKSAFIEKKK
jgi:chromosome segregation ATPase